MIKVLNRILMKMQLNDKDMIVDLSCLMDKFQLLFMLHLRCNIDNLYYVLTLHIRWKSRKLRWRLRFREN